MTKVMLGKKVKSDVVKKNKSCRYQPKDGYSMCGHFVGRTSHTMDGAISLFPLRSKVEEIVTNVAVNQLSGACPPCAAQRLVTQECKPSLHLNPPE
ncbi:hypothetical protein PIB30_013087 [Stylosanthes scabra]|uniref:Uncharacterized protein n=1 Tax=Stylosanthes scabra TaxID=79078 RepID=A0ABU6U7Z7_9FABA|nr:hypothetical protein [Stylosanthes scabra]